MTQLLESLALAYCRAFGCAPMWPVNGAWRCRVCLRCHPVPWNAEPVRAVVAVPRIVKAEVGNG